MVSADGSNRNMGHSIMTDENYRQIIETEIDFTAYHLFILDRPIQTAYPDCKKWSSWLILMGLIETWDII